MYVDYKENPQDEMVKRLTLNANTSDNLGFLGQENQKIILIKDQTYGTSFPTENLVDGQLFFKDISEDTSYLTSSQIQNLSDRLEETQENKIWIGQNY